MSISSEINRISTNISDALDAVSGKGVTVPAGSNSDDLASLIQEIPNTDVSDTTATPADVLPGKVFYAANGTRSTGALSTATQSADGLMSSTDKTKLDGIAEGATANIGTITGVTMNGVSKGTSGVVDLGVVLTAHQDISGKADKSEIPTKVSELTNDSGFTSNIGTITGITMNGTSKGTSGVVDLGNVATQNNPSFTGDISGNGSIVVGPSEATGMNSQAFGWYTTASGAYSHAEGRNSVASTHATHAEGSDTTASGWYSHAEGYYTTANHKSQHVFGEYNIEDPSTNSYQVRGNFIEIVGNGTSESTRSNARTLDWNGNERLKGTLYVNANANGTGGTQVLTRGTTWGDLKGT